VLDRTRGAAGEDLGLDSGVLVLGGPTASGKSELAAAMAGAVGGVVVSADSRQVYRGLEIGTSQPDGRLRALAPHYLVGFLSPAASYSAGEYGADARRVLAALRGRGIPAVLCGGTGLYLRAAVEGVPGHAEGDAAPEAEKQSRLARRAALAGRWTAEGAEALHGELARADARLAARLHPRDRQRVLRGLEFHAAHGRPLSATWRARAPGGGSERRTPGPLRYRLELPARDLERRIHARLAAMLRQGLLEEVRALFERYGADPPGSLNAVGYPELFDHFRGKVDLDGALERIRLRSRQYAKRQRTWFHNQDGYAPVAAGEETFSALLAAWRERLP
jgi:tRNA dimethylallyltransferase